MYLKSRVFKGDRPTYSGPVKGKGYMVQFEYSNYIIKMYDKGAQYRQPNNILRFEVKTKKMQHIQKTRIGNLEDLKDRSKLLILREILIDLFDKVQTL